MKQLSFLFLLVVLSCSEKQLYESSSAEPNSQVNEQATNETAAYDAYVGEYQMQDADFDKVLITQEDGKLYVQATGERKVEIYPQGENSFNVPAFNALITFKDSSGKSFSEITILLNGAELIGKKL
jgi:TPR repeat protein